MPKMMRFDMQESSPTSQLWDWAADKGGRRRATRMPGGWTDRPMDLLKVAKVNQWIALGDYNQNPSVTQKTIGDQGTAKSTHEGGRELGAGDHHPVPLP